MVSRFWEIDHLSNSNPFNSNERYCEKHYEETYTRTSSGRFVVQVPILEDKLQSLGETKEIAMKRFLALERKLDRQPELKRDYSEFIHEYIALGHMEEVIKDEGKKVKAYYLPHHPVIKETSTTTKLRVVFDGSCKSTSGVSLNDIQLVGPTLQQDLFSILVRYRTFQVVFKGDIAKMYRQVLLNRCQTPLQRILWRDNENEEIKTFELLTVTYGTASASYLAVKSLRQLAHLMAAEYPKGAAVILQDFYVDDLLTGAETIEETIAIRNEVLKILESGGFELRKWASNAFELRSEKQCDSVETDVLSFDKEESTSTLGIQWHFQGDHLRYNIPEQFHHAKITKGSILSSVAQIFDPLGLLGPIIIVAKIIIQDLWQLKLDWDESVPLHIHTKWSRYSADLMHLHKLSIPRKLIKDASSQRIELHGFADASQQAYGACIYMRCTDAQGTHTSQLVCAKSRVAPLKNVSLPRLELCGALVLAQLMKKVKEAININIDQTHYWSDSTIALNWICSSARKWNVFVANRVGEIQEFSPVSAWHHVPTQDNPADIISRGLTGVDLINSQLWWNGPHWLIQDASHWPASPIIPDQVTLPELRKTAIVLISQSACFGIIERQSNFAKLVRVTAYCLLFIRNSSKRVKNKVNSARCSNVYEKNGIINLLKTADLKLATQRLVKYVQQTSFAPEIAALNNGNELPRNSKLLSLNPFLDDDGVVRVGGRLRHARLPYASKCQILLPGRHHFTKLLIEYEHKRNLHAGVQGTLTAIRSQYWPLSAKTFIRQILKKCVKCFRSSPTPAQYVMGNLPACRLVPSRPFNNCGVDYCGPFLIKDSKRRKSVISKAYVSIFVCLATKAVHIELVSDLTTESFISALRRFICRRGKISNIYSDNGTNFVGANNELRELKFLFDSEDHSRKIFNFANEELFKWHFIPPKAPNFGGLWEAAVKSAKYHLRRVAGDSGLVFEEMYTLLVQIEAVLNSRPLTPISNDPNDLSFLTPGHFLIGESFTSFPEPNLTDLPVNRLDRFQHIERIKQHFWKRWSKEYLLQHQQRNKWQRSKGEPLSNGQLVIIREDDLPPLCWTVGRIQEVHPGSDGVVRAATVKTSKGQYKRPASKLCILPVDA